MDLTISFLVQQTPQQVFDAICNVRGWWGRDIEGDAREQGDEFIYRHKEIHYSHHRLTSVIPNRKVEWLTTEGRLNFVDQADEWTGTTIVFDIDEEGGKTAVRFRHLGLTPQLECFSACSGGWKFYIGESLRALIVTGEGKPD